MLYYWDFPRKWHGVWRRVHDDVFTILHTTNARIYCLLMMFIDVGAWCLVERLHVRHVYEWELRRMLHCEFKSNWQVIHIIPYISSSFKSDPNGFLYPMPNPSTQTMLYYASTMSYHANCTYSSLPRLKEEMRLANSYNVAFILNFSHSTSMAKLALHSTSKILNNLQFVHTIWGFISFHTWEHHIIACLTLGTLFFKSLWVVEESN